MLGAHEVRVLALVVGDLATLNLYVSEGLVFTTPYGTLLTEIMLFDSTQSEKMGV